MGYAFTLACPPWLTPRKYSKPSGLEEFASGRAKFTQNFLKYFPIYCADDQRLSFGLIDEYGTLIKYHKFASKQFA